MHCGMRSPQRMEFRPVVSSPLGIRLTTYWLSTGKNVAQCMQKSDPKCISVLLNIIAIENLLYDGYIRNDSDKA